MFIKTIIASSLRRPSLTLVPKPVGSFTSHHGVHSSASAPSFPNKVVFISQSEDIFSNLAIEAWLYKNWCFKKRHLLLLWRNAPCVVIGRHQNPFKEVNLPYLESAGVPFARRQSGGGAVYHDLGNLNCTFFTPRDGYNRDWNLNIVKETLGEDFGLDVIINSRHDIVMNGDLKVSGSAAKLGGDKAYHHCSLLFKTDHQQLSLALKGDLAMSCRGTESIRSPVGNLASANAGHFPVDEVLNKIAFRYLEASLPGQESGSPAWNRTQSHGLTLINPQDDWFPGLGEIITELKSWDWLYGKTPRFTKTLRIKLPEYLGNGNADSFVSIDVECQHGRVLGVHLTTPNVSAEVQHIVETDVSNGLKGTPYSTDISSLVESLLRLPQHHTGTM